MVEQTQAFVELKDEDTNNTTLTWDEVIPYNRNHIYNGGMSYRLCGGYRYLPKFYNY